jgi:hypothetical protein
MARRVREVIDVIDDLTQQQVDDAEALEFTYRGVTYAIDLGPDSARRMDEAMAPFIEVARKVGRKTGAKSKRIRSDEPRRIREWAKAKGMKVSPRGRIDEEVVKAFHAESAQAGTREP